MGIRWTSEAAENLDEIHQYLSLNRPEFLEPTIQAIYDGILSVRDFPYRGRPGKIQQTRELIISEIPYIVVYTIRHDTIIIVSIRHTSREPLTH